MSYILHFVDMVEFEFTFAMTLLALDFVVLKSTESDLTCLECTTTDYSFNELFDDLSNDRYSEMKIYI